MIDFLLGVPGKLATIIGWFTNYWTAARAAKIDYLDAAISSRAPASTAVSNADYTSALATKLNALKGTLNTTPTAIKNTWSSSGWSFPVAATTPSASQFPLSGVATSLSGALTANTLATVLNITGAGVLNMLGISTVDSTSRKLRMKLTLDGIVVFDSTSGALAGANLGFYCVGGWDITNVGTVGSSFNLDQIPFATSCLFEIASSLTETAKFNIFMKYRIN
jgi:hypothetical protein